MSQNEYIKYAKVLPITAEVLSADQLWNNDEVMALNAELGLTIYQLLQLANAITRITHKIPPADWRERFSQAVYDDLAAADNQDVPLEEYPALILKVLDAVIGHEMNPAPSEVPMPEPEPDRVTQIGHGPRIYSHSPQQFKKWGESCWAAGEAAGYARGVRGERDECAALCRNIYSWPGAYYAGPMDTATLKAAASAIEARSGPKVGKRAALRGEVK